MLSILIREKSGSMEARSVSIPKTIYRQASFDRAAINEEDRTVELTISSEAPYDRYWGTEILDHSRGAVEMSNLQDGAPALFNHDRNAHLGTILEARNDGKNLRIKVKFSRSAFAEEKWQDVKDGILLKSSVGYEIRNMELEKEEKGRATYRVTSWCPMEGSLVTLPADWSTGIGKSDDETPQTREILISAKKSLANENEKAQNPAMSEPAVVTDPKIDVVAERNTAIAAERKRVADIRALAKHFATNGLAGRKIDTNEAAEDAIATGKTEREFQDIVVRGKFEEAKPVNLDPNIGLSKKETESFSLLRAIRNIASKRFDGTFEARVSEAACKHYGRSNISETTIVLPEEVTNFAAGGDERAFDQAVRTQAALWGQRAQNATTATAGGFTVPTFLGSMIELLRNKTVLGQMGITQLSGLTGDIALPVQTSGATAYWVSETGALTDSESAFQQKTLTPHRLGATTPFSSQFIAQSSLPAEQFVRAELMRTLAIALDLAGLLGTGANGQPLGVANTAGINATVTYGGTANWADVVEHETGIAVDNADIGSMGFILDSATVGKWKTILKDSVAGAGYLLSDNMTANGYPVARTNQTSAAHQSFFGVWSQLILATWAGMEVIVDPYTLKKSGQVEVTMNSLHDYLVRQPLAFNVSTDSAAQ